MTRSAIKIQLSVTKKPEKWRKKSFGEFSTQTEMNFEWKKGSNCWWDLAWVEKIFGLENKGKAAKQCQFFQFVFSLWVWCSCVPATWPPPPHKTNEPRPISGGTYSIEGVLTWKALCLSRKPTVNNLKGPMHENFCSEFLTVHHQSLYGRTTYWLENKINICKVWR